MLRPSRQPDGDLSFDAVDPADVLYELENNLLYVTEDDNYDQAAALVR